MDLPYRSCLKEQAGVFASPEEAGAERLPAGAGSRPTPLLLSAHYLPAPTRASWDISCVSFF